MINAEYLYLQNLCLQCQITTTDNQITHHQNLTIGVDEVGRGTLFAHLTVAAAILPNDLTGYFDQLQLKNTELQLLNDSKKLTEKRREWFFDLICHLSLDYAIVDVPRQVIDEINIANATRLGMKIAIETLLAKHKQRITQVLIDGTDIIKTDHSPQTDALIKGDARHSSIACASILAKVHRDRQMIEYGKRYPEYFIEKHKGYLTAAHKQAILTHGILPEHRRSFSPITQLYQSDFLNKKYWENA